MRPNPFQFSIQQQLDENNDRRELYPRTELVVKPRRSSESYLRVAQLSPELPVVDVYIDQRLVAKALRYKERSQYRQLKPGKHTLAFYPFDKKTNPIFQQTINMPSASILTAVVFDMNNQTPSIRLINDKTSIDPGEVMVKFAHFSPNAPNVDVIFNKNIIITDIGFTEVSGYIAFPPTEADISLRNVDTQEVLYTLPNVVFQPDKAYTLYATGFYDGEPPLQVVTYLDGSSYLVE